MSLRIEVPATLANLGSGYDALGLAVSLSNRFEVELGPPDAAPDLVALTALAASRSFGGQLPGFRVRQDERVPRSRGMGSSATARVAGLLVYQSLCEVEVDLADQLRFLAEQEGHPDNAWPALLGGLVLCGGTAKRLTIHPSWTIAICNPMRQVSTPQARRALPEKILHADAVANLRAVSMLVAGLLDGDVEAVRAGVLDRLHQPYRAPLIGPVDACFAAARQLGAAPFISGSGSTLAAFVPQGVEALGVARAMAAPLEAGGGVVVVRALRPRTMGATVADLR